MNEAITVRMEGVRDPESLRTELADLDAALTASGDGVTIAVDWGSDVSLLRLLDHVERWQQRRWVGSATVTFAGRSYLLPSAAAA